MFRYIEKDNALTLIKDKKEVRFKCGTITFKLKEIKAGFRVSVYKANVEEVLQYKLGARVGYNIFNDFDSAYDYMYDLWYKMRKIKTKQIVEMFDRIFE